MHNLTVEWQKILVFQPWKRKEYITQNIFVLFGHKNWGPNHKEKNKWPEKLLVSVEHRTRKKKEYSGTRHVSVHLCVTRIYSATGIVFPTEHVCFIDLSGDNSSSITLIFTCFLAGQLKISTSEVQTAHHWQTGANTAFQGIFQSMNCSPRANPNFLNEQKRCRVEGGGG